MPETLESLEPQEGAEVRILANPPAGTEPQWLVGNILVSGSGVSPISLGVSINVLAAADAKREVHFELSGPDSIPVMNGGRVIVKRVQPAQMTVNGQSIPYQPQLSKAADANGTVVFDGDEQLEVGKEYTYQAWGDNYLLSAGTFVVRPLEGGQPQGQQAQVEKVILQADHFIYTWTVSETSIDLTYNIQVTITFASGEPAPRPDWCTDISGCGWDGNTGTGSWNTGGGGGGGSGGVNLPPNITPPPTRYSQMNLSHSVVLAWQAFDASLWLQNTSGAALENTSVELKIFDQLGADSNDAFILRRPSADGLGESVPPVTQLDNIISGGEATAGWLIIPKAEGLTEPTRFQVAALIHYELGGVTYSYLTLPQWIEVRPAPSLDIHYMLPNEEITCAEFELRAIIVNNGAGPAVNLRYKSLSPTTNDKTVTFTIVSARVNGETQPDPLNLELGDLTPGEDRVVAWRIRASRPVRLASASANLLQGGGLEGLTPVVHSVTMNRVPATCLMAEIPDESTNCPDCWAPAQSQGTGGDPVNTRTGGFSYPVEGMSLSTSSGALGFRYLYVSLATDEYTGLMGPGWTHNHDIRLIFPPPTIGEGSTPDFTRFKDQSGNMYRFIAVSDDDYVAYPGFSASLVKNEGTSTTYTLTDSAHNTYLFDAGGRLQTYTDANGRAFSYTYNQDGKLERVTAPGDGRYLQFLYNAVGNLDSVADHTGRSSISFDYGTAGDLESVTDVLDQTWTYEYDAHQLLRANYPDGSQKVRNEYDPQALGRVIKQFDGADKPVLELTPQANGAVQITNALGQTQVHSYNVVGTLTGSQDGMGNKAGKRYDLNFRPTNLTDALGNATSLTWSPDGANLTSVTDSQGNLTEIQYVDNQPTKIIDAFLRETDYGYENNLLKTVTQYDDQGAPIVTRYHHTSIGLIETITDPAGTVTRYEYNEYGERIRVIANYDAATYDEVTYQSHDGEHNLVTQYSYDDLGRVTEVIDPSGIKTQTGYDNAGRVTETTRSDRLGQNSLTTEYRYDIRGNQIAFITHLPGNKQIITRTWYDANNRPVTTVQNLYVNGSLADIDVSPSVVAYNPDHPDRNLRNDTVYDDAGNVIATIDSAGVITRTWYDEANRPTLTVQNLVVNGTLEDVYTLRDDVPDFDTDFPDRNLKSKTFYDENGNYIASKSFSPDYPSGIVSRTYYDELNRPVLMVQNLSGHEITNPDWPACGTSSNLCTRTYYDAVGNVIATVDPLGRISRTYYNALNQPVVSIQNLVMPGFSVEAAINTELSQTPGFDPDHPDRNLRTDTIYDSSGRVIATQDPAGRITRTYHDSAGRVASVVQNLTGQAVSTATPPERNFDTPDENVRTDTLYDQYGRREITVDPLNRQTKYVYDDFGRLSKTIANYLAGQEVNFQYPDSEDKSYYNLVTEYEYDALGRTVKVTDTLGNQTVTEYDDLGRVISTTRNKNESAGDPGHEYNLTTTYQYDRSGRQVAVTGPGDQVTRTYYDALGRAISMVSNLTGWEVSNPEPPERGEEFNFRADTMYDALGRVTSTFDPLGRETAYRYDSLGRQTMVIAPGDIRTQFLYNAAGQLMNKTDAENVITHFEYDDLGRLTAVVENYRPAYLPDEKTNVRTEYSYDASGNRLTIRDGNGHVTRFAYDNLNRLRSETDAVGHTWQYEYDARGSRTRLLDANQQETRYSYNALGQVTKIDYPGEDIDVAFEYDPLGRREQMSDSLGTTTWDYDALGRPRSITDPFDQTVYYGYNATGNRASLTYPDDKTVTYNYNEANRLSDVTDWNDQVTQYRYDPLGRLTEILRPNGVNTTYSFDETGNLEQLLHSTQNVVLSSFNYQYDAVGNRTQAIESTQPGQAGSDITVSVVETSGTPVAGKTVHAFKGSMYTGYSKATDANGQAVFSLPEGSYRFRVIVDGTRFYSGSTDHCTVGECAQVAMSIPQPVLVTVLDSDGMAQAGLNVSAYDGETFSGMSGTTDANGQVSLRLPVGEYRFLTEFNGTPFWSDLENHCAAPECTMAQVNVTKPVTVTVSDSVWTAVAGQTVHAWQGLADTGYSAVTAENGQAQFTLPAGDYRFSTEFDGETFWSSTDDSCSVVSSSAAQGPGCEALDLRVALPLAIRVVDTEGQPVAGADVEAFDGETTTGRSAVTDEEGRVSLTLPAGSYRFRAAYDSAEYWSGASNHCEIFSCPGATITIPAAAPQQGSMQGAPDQGYRPAAFTFGMFSQSETTDVTITVLDADGNPRADVPVTAFDGATPSGQSGTTDANGQVTLSLPDGSYRFRAEFSSIYYWSGTENHCATPDCTAANITVALPATVTVFDPDAGIYRTGLTVHAWQGMTDTGYSAVTDENGQASLTLPIGNYRFMVELDGAQFFSESFDHCDVPNCRGADMWVFGPRTVTVRQKDGTLVEDATVEAYTETAYTGLSDSSDENGVAHITLAQGWYRFRVQVPSGQYWSGDQVHCKTPDCKGVTVVVDTYDTIPVAVLNTNGTPQGANHPVTAFMGETATEQNAVSDDNGQAILTLLEGNYRFRALYEGAPFWSSAVDHCAIPGCSGTVIEVSLTTQVNVRNVDGQPVAGVEVYAFDGDTYTNFSCVTDDNGMAYFVLPFGNYRFRVNTGGASFWSGTENHYTLPTTWPYVDITVGTPVMVSLNRQSGASAANMTVDVYSETGYIGRTGTTGSDGKVSFALPDGEYRFRVEYNGIVYWSGVCQVPGCESSEVTILDGLGLQNEVIIDYDYDPLYRLTAASYSTGDSYTYAYDAVGNRLAQQSMVNGLSSAVAYAYDDANRLLGVSTGSTVYDPLTALTYTWDANGNLLSDGVNTYTYDAANRLSTLNGPSTTVGYAYNGMGDRLQETANGSTTTFTMDLNTGLTQALSDGTYTYTYGLGRIAQYDTTAEYFLGDALGSVRQLTDAQGRITLAKAYNPYGEVTQSAGAGQSSYGYTNEYHDGYNDLVYLRARHYAPAMGRFLSKDTWAGEANHPLSLNRWNYVGGNPVVFADPSGHCKMLPDKPIRCEAEPGDYIYKVARNYGFAESELKTVVVWNKMIYGDNWDENSIGVGFVIYLEDPTPYSSKLTPIRSGQRFNGYVEGRGATASVGFFTIGATGREIVYNFETLESAVFTYTGEKNIFWQFCGLSSNLVGLGESHYTGFFHFPSRDDGNLEKIYSGKAMTLSASASIPMPNVFDGTLLGTYAQGGGITSNFSLDQNGASPDFYKSGVTISVTMGMGKSPVRLPVEVSLMFLYYTMDPGTYKEYSSYAEMANDIQNGANTDLGTLGDGLFFVSRTFFAEQLRQMYVP